MKPRLRPLRSVAAVVALAAVALGASGCANSTINDAARVGDTSIPRSELQNDLKDMLQNEQFVTALKSGGSNVIIGRDGKSVDSRFTANWLTILIQQAAIDNLFDKNHLTVDSATRASAAQQLAASFADQNGASYSSGFPKRFQDAMVERLARRDTVLARVKPTIDDARAFYEDNKAVIFPCTSGKTVSHIVSPTYDEANLVLAQLRGGVDFATLAKERSTDKATAATGGLITSTSEAPGCFPRGQPAALAAAVAKAQPGYPSGPVQTPAGYQVFVAKPYSPPPFEQVQALLLQSLSQTTSSSSAPLDALMARQLHNVYVDPRYGKWVPIDAQQGPHVQPPVTPKVADNRNGTSSTTTASLPVG
jgi:parvulin-like peptidyl-prolyl isomerase